jgi:hypothetical protein
LKALVPAGEQFFSHISPEVDTIWRSRPFLFRANSLPILQAFTHEHVPHPHADAISADAFAMRVIRSETDYAVYAGAKSKNSRKLGASDHDGYTGAGGGMRGADVAFYQHRARYHTPEDSIRAMGREGSRRALWASMEIVRGAGAALLDAPAGALGEDVVGDAEPSTFFERTLSLASKPEFG